MKAVLASPNDGVPASSRIRRRPTICLGVIGMFSRLASEVKFKIRFNSFSWAKDPMALAF
jgi:hypothetical protein